MRNRLMIGMVASGMTALFAGCAVGGSASASGYVGAGAPVVFVEEPTLVVVEPGVWVVRDYDYAVYYVAGYYWVYRDDVWHRSRAYDGDWATVEVNVVPRVIAHRDHRAYVHYHGAANAQTRKAHERFASVHDDHGRSERADHGQGPPGHDKDEGRKPPPRHDREHDDKDHDREHDHKDHGHDHKDHGHDQH